MNKWYRTTNGNGKKTFDCKDIERAAVSVLEGKREGITELIIADQTVESAEPSIDGGYRFIGHNGNIFDLDAWKWVYMEEFRSTLFIYVTDYKPAE